MHRIVVDVQSGEITEVELTQEEIEELQSRPQPPTPPALTAEQRLEAAGLTIADLKTLLGLD